MLICNKNNLISLHALFCPSQNNLPPRKPIFYFPSCNKEITNFPLLTSEHERPVKLDNCQIYCFFFSQRLATDSIFEFPFFFSQIRSRQIRAWCCTKFKFSNLQRYPQDPDCVACSSGSIFCLIRSRKKNVFKVSINVPIHKE